MLALPGRPALAVAVKVAKVVILGVGQRRVRQTREAVLREVVLREAVLREVRRVRPEAPSAI